MLYSTNYGYKVSVEIVRDTQTDTARVIVHAPMYMRKKWEMSHSYRSSHFSDYEILHDSDFIRVMSGAYPRNH